jgi:hypothetical protein
MSTNSPIVTLAVPLQPTDHRLGAEHARVTVVEYADFECPTCKLAAPTVKMLLDQFPSLSSLSSGGGASARIARGGSLGERGGAGEVLGDA